MGDIGGLIGLGGGVAGTGISGPQGTNLRDTTTNEEILNAYNNIAGDQGALAQQQALVKALQAQNGLANQSQVYGQLQNVAAGQGPNPAQAMLNQATGQNVANQAALMAGQRGANANVGLLARQAAQQGANTQQQSVGQGAALQAQQSLNALGAAGNMANTQAGQQIGATTTATQAQLAEQQALLNATAQYNNAKVAMQSNINNANAGLAGQQMQGQQGLIGGLLNTVGVPATMAEGGDVPAPMNLEPTRPQPLSSFGQFLAGWTTGDQQVQNPDIGQTTMPSKNVTMPDRPEKEEEAPDKAGIYPTARMTPGEAHGGLIKDYRGGGNVKASNPKQKAVVKGNSYQNDKIPAVLSEGEVVIPRDVMQSKDPARAAASFVQSVMAKRKAKGMKS